MTEFNLRVGARRHISGFYELSSSPPSTARTGLPIHSVLQRVLPVRHLDPIHPSIHPAIHLSIRPSARPAIRVLVGAVKSHERNYQPRKQATLSLVIEDPDYFR